MGTFSASATKTRPADTTQYAISDVIGDGANWTFELGPAKAHVIRNAKMVDSAAPGTLLQADLFLFSVAPAVAADNAANAFTDAEMLNCVGIISFASPIAGLASGNCLYQTNPVNGLQLKSANNNGIIYGVLVARNTYTPISAEVFKITLEGEGFPLNQ